MGLLERILTRSEPRSLENPRLSLNDPAAWEEAGLLDEKTQAGVRVTHKKALGHAPVWRGVNLIANTIARLKGPIVYENGDNGNRSRAKSHLAYPLLKQKPNKFITVGQFTSTLTYHAVFYGNGYALIHKDRMGRVVPLSKGGGLVVLSPIETVPFQRNGEVWYATTINNKREFFSAEEILHIKGPLSFDGITGLSVIEQLAEALAVGIAARDFAARFFGQGANASGILMIPEALKPDAVRQAIKDFEKVASGVKNQHRVAVLQNDVKWQPMTIDPVKSQMEQTQNFDIRVVANVLGLPPHKLGDVTRQGYASLEQENQSFLDESIDPWLCRWEEELNDKMLTDAERESESHFIEFNRAALLRADLLTRYQAYAVGKQWGWLNTNRILAKENEELIGAEGDEFWAPGNMLPIGKLGEDPAKTAQTPAPDKTQAEGIAEESVRSATLDAVMERITHLAKVEAEQVQRAGKREKDFAAWANKFYVERAEKYDEVLLPLVKVWGAASGRSTPAFLRGVTNELTHRLVERSREKVLATDPAALDSFAVNADELRALVVEVLGAE